MLVRFTLRSAEMGNVPNDPTQNLNTYQSKVLYIKVNTYTLRPKFSSVLLYDQRFSRYDHKISEMH